MQCGLPEMVNGIEFFERRRARLQPWRDSPMPPVAPPPSQDSHTISVPSLPLISRDPVQSLLRSAQQSRSAPPEIATALVRAFDLRAGSMRHRCLSPVRYSSET